MTKRDYRINSTGDGLSITFDAMASPCEILLDSHDVTLAQKIATLACQEVWRIEDKFSRYNNHGLCAQINQSQGLSVAIDPETVQLLQFANQCYQLSDGLFDLTAGVLRRAWRFDGSDHIANQSQIDALLPLVDWQKVSFDANSITLPSGMELDFGGIGKEYAVDRVILLIKHLTTTAALVNLGGDLAATGPRQHQQNWLVGIEHPGLDAYNNQLIVSLQQGALATSGDAKRFLLRDGIRYSHILNAKTGWPMTNAARSVTVAAPQCTQAGLLATLALLQGSDAEPFLAEQTIANQPLKYWLIR